MSSSKMISVLQAAARDRTSLVNLIAHILALAFVFYGLTAVGILAINMPPFQNADEGAHFARAAQIAHGELIAFRFSRTSVAGKEQVSAGGHIDPAIMTALERFQGIPFHPNSRVTQAHWTPAIHWTGTLALEGFANTALYPPFFYLPAALGVRLGELLRLTVLQTLTLSRLLTGISAIAIGAVAIAWAGGGAPWLFAILTLPMSLALIASVSQDSLLVSCSAFAGSLLIRASRSVEIFPTKLLVWLAIVLSLVAIARPPYAAFALLLLVLPKVPMQSRLLAIAWIAACVTFWSAIVATRSLTNYGASIVDSDPATQLGLLKNDPLVIFSIAFRTVITHWREYMVQFVGQLGWLDVPLRPLYHLAARLMLIVGLIAAIFGLGGVRVALTRRLTVVGALLLSLAGVFFLIYVTFNHPGNPMVDNVQGRYFIPVVLCGALLLSGITIRRWGPLFYVCLVTALIAFPVVSISIVSRALILRYYLW